MTHSPLTTVLNNLKHHGVHIFGEILDSAPTDQLYQKMLAARSLGKHMFLSEEEYIAQGHHQKSNPTPQFNFLNHFEEDLKFIESHPLIQKTLHTVLGEDYEIVIKKAVCGVPKTWLPTWVENRIKDVNVANLGAYLKPEYRDITYFRGIDFHQDIIDWPQGSTDLDPATFMTLYVYLHEVTPLDSPLHVLPDTHQFGASLFPHRLTQDNGNHWIYQDDTARTLHCTDQILTGKAGYVGLWHNCTLHGTMPVQHESENFRLSLRYLIAKSNKNSEKTYIDEINQSIQGELKPLRTRRDLDEKGFAILRGNIINQAK